ncbi:MULTISPECIES: DUF4167 domain-containing protein [unclassified Sphingomonas]|uniref:DUF4167 domain-containing protein n=1 Tax=unclassified Sphingomonas TaxID=196159 RepID=UPI00226A7775|nr:MULTISPECIES: DUF4167 domain-containing protein [unclassified Sphingomonas]
MINNRQNGRRRGRGGNNNNNGGGGAPRQGGGQGRPDNGNRIDSRARGNANQLFEKYKNLASDAQRQGDRVNTEYYLQFADHYFRVIADQRGRFEDQQPRRQQPFELDGDDDYGDEGEPIRAGEQDGDSRDDRQERNDRQSRDDRPRDDRQARDDRPARDDRQDRQPPRRAAQDGDQPRQPRSNWEDRGGNREAPREDRAPHEDRVARDERGPREERAERAPREDRPREDRPREERPLRRPRFEQEQPVEVAGQRRSDPLAEGESLVDRAETVLEADAPLQRPRRGRPRRDAQPVVAADGDAGAPAPQATDAGGESNGFEADRLPPSLNIAAANDAEEAPKPRRRRTPRATVEAPAAE